MPLQYFVDSGAYKRAGSEYFVALLHVFCTVVRIKSDEDLMTKTVRYVGTIIGT